MTTRVQITVPPDSHGAVEVVILGHTLANSRVEQSRELIKEGETREFYVWSHQSLNIEEVKPDTEQG